MCTKSMRMYGVDLRSSVATKTSSTYFHAGFGRGRGDSVAPRFI